jgi:RNA polymerase sigma-70 factor (ECF subfamily)
MEAARAARAGRRKNLSLRQLAPGGAKRQNDSFDAAYETFYREHVAGVYQYALAVLGNTADAEDVTQQTFLNAYRAFQGGERPRKPHNWLIKIAHNVCRMRWRQASRRPQEIPLESAREPVALDHEKPSLDEVLDALRELPFNQRAAIVMREVEDRSYAEIADVLETTVPAVEALLFRARTNLRARRKALAGALSIAPLPASLTSFFGGGGGGLVAAGGAVFGSELALKIAAVVATGVVAGGLGFKTVNAIATADPASRPSAPQAHHDGLLFDANPVRRLERAAQSSVRIAAFRHSSRPAGAARGELQRVPTRDRPSETGLAAADPTAGPADPTAGITPADTVKHVVASIPQTPVTPPASVTVTTPALSVTVPVPPVQLPPPPPLK